METSKIYLVMDDLPDDLLHPPTDAAERPIEAALHGQPALGAVALAARWEWAVDKRAQLVLPVLHLMCMQETTHDHEDGDHNMKTRCLTHQTVGRAVVRRVCKEKFLLVHLDSPAAHGLRPDLGVVHRPERQDKKLDAGERRKNQ